LKYIVPHNENKYGSNINRCLNETERTYFVLEKIKYEHQWVICVELKMINLTLKQQRAHTKYPCASGIAETKKKHHWIRKEWPKREKSGCWGVKCD